MHVQILLIAFLIFDQTSAVQAGSGAKRYRKSKAYRAVTKQMHPVVRRFLDDHECKVNVTNVRNEEGFARWTNVLLKCHNLEDPIPTVLCDKRCVDPTNCKKLKRNKYRPVPIMNEIVVTDRNKTKQSLKVPIACQCTSKRRKCNKTSKRRKSTSV